MECRAKGQDVRWLFVLSAIIRMRIRRQFVRIEFLLSQPGL